KVLRDRNCEERKSQRCAACRRTVEEGFCLMLNSLEFLVALAIFLHPGDALVIQPAGLILFAQLPVRHGQVEEIKPLAAGGEVLGFLECRARSLPVPRSIVGAPQSSPACA